ncbi:MAG: transglycosylase domain-containing protein, partial [Planctomycetota bacterium]
MLATEDRRFYKHWGIDPGGLTRAAFANLRAGRFVQGGSTITQQLAKNLFLSPERTIARKLEEISIALWLELRLTKKQILELYLNQVYFGAGAYGIEAAAQKYFDKSARALSIREAALIAGLLQAPTRYSPFRNPGLARRRGDAVIGKMHRAGFIDRATARTARSAKLKFAKADASGKSARQLGYAIDYVLAHMPQLSGLEQGIIIVETTIDAGLQRKAQTVLAQTLARARGGRRARGQGAIVVMDGESGVRAIVGGRSYRQSQFNRAIKAQRQPGSAFKPFVFLAALESGLTPDTTVYDLPVTIGNWSPRNASGKFEGAMTLRKGLSRSVNTVAVRLQQQLGAGAVMSAARKLGITSKLRRDPTLALGTSEVSTLEMTTAYAALANGGLKVAPHVISRVRTHSGRLLYAPSARTPRRVLDGKTVGA